MVEDWTKRFTRRREAKWRRESKGKSHQICLRLQSGQFQRAESISEKSASLVGMWRRVKWHFIQVGGGNFRHREKKEEGPNLLREQQTFGQLSMILRTKGHRQRYDGKWGKRDKEEQSHGRLWKSRQRVCAGYGPSLGAGAGKWEEASHGLSDKWCRWFWQQFWIEMRGTKRNAGRPVRRQL